MAKITVPLMASIITEDNREDYLSLIRRANASRLLLAIDSPFSAPISHLSFLVSFFKAAGIETGIWTNTIGHGWVLDHASAEEDRFPQMVDINGKGLHNANCPLSDEFISSLCSAVSALAETGADFIMLDDDFRLSQHGGGLCCYCSAHLDKISEALGETVTLDTLRPNILSGKKNRYRTAALRVQKHSLLSLAKALREALPPSVNLFTATASSVWNVDGVDMAEIAFALAGENEPILRLTGAPYWAYSRDRRFTLIGINEISRMLCSFVYGKGIELLSEGDSYPRPRYNCPASYLELYDSATRADGGYDGILKYLFDYTSSPEFETGYLRYHEKNFGFQEEVSASFKGGANAGVRVYTFPNTFEDADLDNSSVSPISPVPNDGIMLSSASIPVIYRGRGITASVFGDNARLIDLSDLSDGAILDGVSALILTERGVDVGLKAFQGFKNEKINRLSDGVDVCAVNGYKSASGGVRFLDCALKEGARALLFSEDKVIAYRYENEAGQRFLVYLYEAESLNTDYSIGRSDTNKNYLNQRVLYENIPWISGKKIPAYLKGNPEVSVMVRQGEGEMAVLILNCFSDPIWGKTLYLDDEYSSAKGVGCEVRLSGSIAEIVSEIPPFTAVLIKLKK